MGRIDQAMRRAAETAVDDASDAPTLEQAHPDAPVEFPNETPDLADAGSEAPPASDGKVKTRQFDRPGTSADPADVADLPIRQTPDAVWTDSTVTESLFQKVRPDLAQKIVIDDRMMPASREQYRKLAAALHHAQQASGLKVVMVASAVAGEGKTLTASNLALTLSESYQRRVLLVDADLRKPMLDKLFQFDAPSGLAEGLTTNDERRLPLHDVSARLTILPAGQPSADPMAVLASNRMRRVIEEARQSFDWVIIDTPPVGLLTDASLLSAMVDGAVMVVKAGATPYELVQRAVVSIGEDRLLGVVLNRSIISENGEGYGYGYGAYGGYAPTPPAAAPPDVTS